MTDQYGQPTEGAAPAQPSAPGTMAPPPPPPPPGMFQPPAQPQSPAPKKRTGLIVGIVILVLVLLCGMGACAVGFSAVSKSNDEKAAVAQAEAHYSAAMDAVKKATASIKKASASSPAQTKAAIAETTKLLRTGRDEIAAAGVSVEALPDSVGKTDYQNSLKAAVSALDALEDLVAYVDTASGMAGKAIVAGKLTKDANKSLNAAVRLGNSSKYSQMRTQAVSAVTNYTKAALLFKQAHALDPSAGLNKAATYAAKRKLQADIIVRMADEGRAGRRSAYNADIKKEAALGKQAEAAGTPAIISDADWAQKRLADLSTKIEAAAKQADELRAKALKELGITQ